MPIDPGISLQAKAPNTTTALSDLLNLQANTLAVKKAQATLASDIAERQAQSSSAQTAAKVAAATADPIIAQQQAATQTAQTGAQQASFNLQNQQHQRTIDQITGLIGDESVRNGDSAGIQSALDQAAQNAIQYGSNPKEVEATIGPLKQLAAQNPKAVQPQLINFLRQGLLGPQQANVIQPNGPTINTGQVQYGVNTNPLSAAPQGVIQNTEAVNQLPPGTQVYDPRSQRNVITSPNGALPAGPSLTEAPTTAGTVDVVNKDFAETQANAANAGNAISILQNIKKYAPGAATGSENTFRLSLASDLARITGLAEGDIKTNTDLLAKNANMLALAGGDTNLARTLAEAANPNIHMSPEGIRKAADQVISIHEMSLAKQRFLNQYKGDPAQYIQRLQQFNQVADPRIFQWPNMTLKDKAEMKGAMTPAEQNAFRSKLQSAEQMGLVQ